jgi:IPT/TIG domain
VCGTLSKRLAPEDPPHKVIALAKADEVRVLIMVVLPSGSEHSVNFASVTEVISDSSVADEQAVTSRTLTKRRFPETISLPSGVRVGRCKKSAMTHNRFSLLLVSLGLLGIIACGGNGPAQTCDFPPSISSLSPTSVTAGGPQFTLTVIGDSFETQSILRFNGASQQTNVINSGKLMALITASDIADPGSAKVSVHSPNTFVPGSLTTCGGDSNSLAFSINP